MNDPSIAVHTSFPRRLLLGAALLWGLFLGGGCDTTVDLPEEPGKAFSMYGSLSPRLDTQTVKVYPMGAQLQRRRAGELDAFFRSVNLVTGERRTWSDSVMIEEDGDPVHVFWAPFRAEYGHTYRVEIVGTRRGTARATVEVPAEVELDPAPAKLVAGNVRAEVHVPTRQEVLPEAILTYRVEFAFPGASDATTRRTVRTNVRLRTGVARLSGGEHRVSVFLGEEIERINDRLADVRGQGYTGPCCLVELLEMRAQVQVVNEEWTFPGDSISAETVTQPGQMSNVENGFGFVGAGYRLEAEIPVDGEVAQAAGFQEEI